MRLTYNKVTLRSFLFTLVLGMALLIISNASAQSEDDAPPPLPESFSSPLNCFDYNKSGSVAVIASTDTREAIPGGTVTFSGTIKNDNNYPILASSLKVKVFQLNDGVDTVKNTDNLVDQFLAHENLTIPAHGSVPVAYIWQVPRHAASGKYAVTHEVRASGIYNLTNDASVERVEFEVKSNEIPTAVFNQNYSTLNEEDTTVTAFPLKFGVGDLVTVTTSITNPSDDPKTIPLQWAQYAWDDSSENYKRHTKTELFTLSPRETKNVSYEVQPQTEAVVYVRATIQEYDVKSIFSVKYVKDGAGETRLSFPSISDFPIKSESELTLFACAHSTNLPLVSGNILTLSLKDKEGAIIHEYRYDGDISSAIGGFGDSLTSQKNINYAVLTATLERNGVIVDKVEQIYDCEAIDPSSCLPDNKVSESFFDMFNTTTKIIALLGAALLAVLTVVFVAIRRRKLPVEDSQIMTTPLMIALFLLGGTLIPVFSVQATTIEKQWATSCSSGWVSTSLIDDSNDGISHLGEDERQGSNLQLCLRTDNPSVGLATEWGWQGCSYGYNFMNVYDDAGLVTSSDDKPWNHLLNENNYRPNGSYDYLWCLGATGGNAVEVNSVWRSGTACNSTETKIVETRSGYYNLNSGTKKSPTESLCLSVKVNGSVGSAHGVAVSSAPSADLCNSGIPSAVSGSGPWTWTCMGENGGSDAYGEAPLFVPPPPPPPNNPPTTSVSGPTTGLVGTAYTFNIQGNDPEGDSVRVYVDWNNDGVADTGSPFGNFSPSGTTENFQYSWTTPGTYIIQANSQDSASTNFSAWTTHTITISPAPVATADLKINGSDSGISVTKNSALNITWTGTNAASCSLYGNGLPGGVVALSGATSAVITATDTYVLTCGTASDAIGVTVVNQAPVAPTVTHPTGQVDFGVSTLFTITGSDPDGDTIFYEVDWNNDGYFDTTTSVVGSGVGAPAGRSWLVTGVQTFQARTVDVNGARSAWTQRSITVNVPSAATAQLEVSVNGEGWSTGDRTVNSSDAVALRWSSTNATSCTGSGAGFDTGNSTAGSDNVNTPSANASQVFQVTCSGPGGSGNSSLTITTRQLANLTVSQNASPNFGTFDAASATYSQVTVYFRTQNNGGSDTVSAADYRFELDLNNDGSYETNLTRVDGIGTIPVGGGENDTETVTGSIPFGTHGVRITADSSGNPGKVSETNESDNLYTGTITTTPPDPGLSIWATPDRVQNGQNTVIDWRATTPYSMSCSIFGPGMATRNFNLLTATAADHNLSAGPITAKSEYTLRCTAAGTTFTVTETVEAQGVLEEI